MNPAFVFLWEDGESANNRMVRCCRESLVLGPMGAYLNGPQYKSVLRVWRKSFDDADSLFLVHTSCAVYMSTMLLWCGWPYPGPWHADGTWGIFGKHSWLQPLDFHHPAWTYVEDGSPDAGDIFYRDYSRRVTADGHVGACVEKVGELWITAEGGGSPNKDDLAHIDPAHVKATNGTVCRMSAKPKNIYDKDSLGRKPIGFWRVSKLGLPTDVSMMPRE